MRRKKTNVVLNTASPPSQKNSPTPKKCLHLNFFTQTTELNNSPIPFQWQHKNSKGSVLSSDSNIFGRIDVPTGPGRGSRVGMLTGGLQGGLSPEISQALFRGRKMSTTLKNNNSVTANSKKVWKPNEVAQTEKRTAEPREYHAG